MQHSSFLFKFLLHMMEACPNLELLDFDFNKDEEILFQFLEELKGKTAKPITIIASTTSYGFIGIGTSESRVNYVVDYSYV